MTPARPGFVLSIQSAVVHGHVGNAAAVFSMRRCGREVWPIDTVIFSNHPGHVRFRGAVRPASALGDLVEGLDALGLFAECAAVLSGYLGSDANGRAVLDAVARVHAVRPEAPWVCDPVMGDREEGTYVDPSVVAFFRDHAVTAAHTLVPNVFELELLADAAVTMLKDAVTVAECLRVRGPERVIVTSIRTDDVGPDHIATALLEPGGASVVRTPRLPFNAKGAGDVLAALFVAHDLAGDTGPAALSRAVSATYALVKRAAALGTWDRLPLIPAQDVLLDPPERFPAERL